MAVAIGVGDCASGVARVDVSVSGFMWGGGGTEFAWALCQLASEAKRVGEAMRTFLMRAVGLAALWERLRTLCRWWMRIESWCGMG